MNYLLGIDVGTTGTKAFLFSEDGREIAHAYRSYPTQSPEIGWREQDPEHWWQAVKATIREVCRDPAQACAVAAIALSSQGGTLVAVDHAMHPVRPAIVWSDKRCDAEYDAYIREAGDARTMYETTGWHLGKSQNAMQIRWMRAHAPEQFQAAAMFLSVPDYLSMRMTGIAAVDLSNAGINQLADIRKGCYDACILRFCGITERQLPKLVHSGDVIGHLTPQAAAELGLSTQTVLVAGAHDQYAVALGAGLCKEGDMLIGTGTCWVVTAIAGTPDFRSGLSQSVSAVPGKWGFLWSLPSGGVCMEWLRSSLAGGENGNSLSYEAINAEAANRRAAENGLFFYPFSGRAAHNQSFTRASFIGLDLSHDRFDLARAIMEGVAFQIVWMMETFSVQPSKEGLKLAGGACKSELWCQILADIAGLPVRIPEVSDLACVGAAILAGTGCGLYGDTTEGYAKLAVRERVLQPDPVRAGMYRELLKRYQQYAAHLGAVYGLSE